MAVLVQWFVAASRGGVLFGVDPVTGDRRHVVVGEAMAGGTDDLVSGRVSAQHYVLSRRGRLLTVDHQPPRVFHRRGSHQRLLSSAQLRALARLSRGSWATFGSPQDVEWAIDGGGRRLLQSHPVDLDPGPSTSRRAPRRPAGLRRAGAASAGPARRGGTGQSLDASAYADERALQRQADAAASLAAECRTFSSSARTTGPRQFQKFSLGADGRSAVKH